jgi:S1-C subfamily serine protease
LAATGTVTNTGRAALGIRGATAVTAAAEARGVIIVSVTPGGAADQAGIRTGDLVTAANAHATPSLAALLDLVATLKAGDKMTFTRSRGSHSVHVTLAQLSAG